MSCDGVRARALFATKTNAEELDGGSSHFLDVVCNDDLSVSHCSTAIKFASDHK